MTAGTTPIATELAEDRFAGLDTWAPEAILAALLDGQKRALAAVGPAIPALAEAARIAAERLAAGGRLVYLAAGSPALISLGDALEIPQTYGIGREQILPILAGGATITSDLAGPAEDDGPLAASEVAAARIGPADCVVAVSASGSTPYTVAGLAAARRAGAATVALAGNPGAPIFASADVAVLLETGPEVISGSTRMGAGTAQKAALNMLSTLIGVQLGHVHDGLMVNVRADNDKLRQRAARIVARIAGISEPAGFAALEASGGAVKPAILLAAGAESPDEADAMLAAAGGHVRAALARLAEARRRRDLS